MGFNVKAFRNYVHAARHADTPSARAYWHKRAADLYSGRHGAPVKMSKARARKVLSA